MMKNKIITIVILLIISATTFAQVGEEIVERNVTIAKRTLSTVVSNVGHNESTVRKSFSRYCKQNFDIKIKKEGNNGIVAEGVRILSISDKTGDLVAGSFREGDKIRFAVGFSLGYNSAINSKDNPADYEKLKSFLRKFVIYHETKYFSEILEDNSKRLKALLSDLKQSEREIQSLTKRIQKIDKEIDKQKDPNKQFDLSNENIANRARIQAINDIVINLKSEIMKISEVVDKTKKELSKLEN